jgi:DNA/RNA endonuclease YhcR with UshA esterase domain
MKSCGSELNRPGRKSNASFIKWFTILAVLIRDLTAQNFAGEIQTEKPKKIPATEADKHYEETITVTGKLAQVTIREKLVYVNLDKKHPDTPLTCVMFARATNRFGDLKQLEGKRVEVRGRIEEYKEKPQIILNSRNQLKVVE